MHIRKNYFLTLLLAFVVCLTYVDRLFFKNNQNFYQRFSSTTLCNSQWNLPLPSKEEMNHLTSLWNQKFTYLGKGAHCQAFISEDQNYVIKFHKYPFRLHFTEKLAHSLFHQVNKKKHHRRERNLAKLHRNLLGYKDSYEHLKEESGLILVHINPSDIFKKNLTVVDKKHNEHAVPLDQVTFILQHKANLIYPTLDTLYTHQDLSQAKQVISQIIQLIVACSQKGYVDHDPILRKNYGLLHDRAILIDLGELVKEESIKEKTKQISHIRELTSTLKQRLENHYPKLLDHYEKEIDKLIF